MKISNEQLHCLNALCDDYEDIFNVTNEVISQTGKKLSPTEVESLLDGLIELRLVDRFFYNSEIQSYVVDEGQSKPSNSCWFYITKKGRVALDENWND